MLFSAEDYRQKFLGSNGYGTWAAPGALERPAKSHPAGWLFHWGRAGSAARGLRLAAALGAALGFALGPGVQRSQQGRRQPAQHGLEDVAALRRTLLADPAVRHVLPLLHAQPPGLQRPGL